MTLDRDHDWQTRLLGALIWFVMSLALSIEICTLIGWAFGHAERGGAIGALLNGLLWLWVLWGRQVYSKLILAAQPAIGQEGTGRNQIRPGNRDAAVEEGRGSGPAPIA